MVNMLKSLAALMVSAFLALGVTPSALAQASGTINPNGVLTASTAAQSFENQLNLLPGTTSGFTFSGATGSFSQTISGDGYYYASYLFSFLPSSDVESATITLNNPSGVTGLSERLYAYTGSFLGDAPAGPNIIQAWVSAVPTFGVSVVNLNANNLSAGTYVLEIRGTNQGNYAGAMSFATPVPEPLTVSMLLSGLALLGGAGMRRRLAA
jgi:hypothetical protein